MFQNVAISYRKFLILAISISLLNQCEMQNKELPPYRQFLVLLGGGSQFR